MHINVSDYKREDLTYRIERHYQSSPIQQIGTASRGPPDGFLCALPISLHERGLQVQGGVKVGRK